MSEGTNNMTPILVAERITKSFPVKDNMLVAVQNLIRDQPLWSIGQRIEQAANR